jgi:two-component system sensor histidine kinase KdpD
MIYKHDNSSSADDWLRKIQDSNENSTKGQLKIFLGMCAGVGKTYAMLKEAHELIGSSKNVIVGYIETHGRAETEKVLEGLEVLPRKKVVYKNVQFEEFDLDEALRVKPDYILVDELAHSNIPGSKHTKRYLDVIELLDNGINVLTTLNIQHIESRSKTVEQITGVKIHETISDSIIEMADTVELVDLPIEELKARLNEGKVYIPEKAVLAGSNFFRDGNLISLREMALRLTAEKVENDLMNYMSEKNIPGPWKSGDKLMVAVGGSPFSAELIRWTRRLSYTLKSKWYAVYVKTDSAYDDKKNTLLQKNLALAKELGAEVITTADIDLVDGLLQIARQKNVSQIIIGKPAKYNILNYLRKDNYIDRLIAQSGNIDIYIVRPDKVTSKEVKKTKIPRISNPAKNYFYSIMSILLIASICFLIKDIIGYQTVGLILLFNLFVLPFYVGRGPVFVAATLNAIIWNYFFIPPLFTFEIAKIHDIITLILNFVVAITTTLFSTRIRNQKQLMQMREKNNLALLNYTTELSQADSQIAVIMTTLKHIDLNFDVNATFLNDKFQQLFSSREHYEFGNKEISIAKWCLTHKKISGKFSENLPDSYGQFLPVYTNRNDIGVICLLLKNKLSMDEDNLLFNMITQMSGVYEKEESNNKIRQMQIESESKRLYDTLIDSISHEFRTPIAVITGASSTLFDEKIIENKNIVFELANEIFTASKRIDLLVENLLDINKLEAGLVKPNYSLNSINEIIYEVIDNMKSYISKREIIFNPNSEMQKFNFDSNFIKQSLFNIIHNGCIYTPENSTITIIAETLGNNCHIQIADNGHGIPENSINKLFDKFYRVPSTKTGGTGLGLSIAKGFIDAHNGSISVKNNIPNGLIFDIILPFSPKK